MKLYLSFLIFIVYALGLNAQKADIMLPSEMSREQVIHHEGFSLSYNSSYLQPSWVAYKVSKAQVNRDDKVRAKYVRDPQIHTRSADKKDYKQGGYVMAQFVNYLDVKQIPNAVEESFYLSNITPMKLAFHNHIWIKTEDLIRLWTSGISGLYIVTGAILADSPFPAIGDNNVSVPKRYYKAVYDPDNKKAIGFIFKNGTSSGKLNSYVVSIDEIEKETGIDLFPSLDDELENSVESGVNLEDWNFELIE